MQTQTFDNDIIRINLKITKIGKSGAKVNK